jgi:hypothetical protein
VNTNLRATAYPGEDPRTVRQPAEVGEAIAALLCTDLPHGATLAV